ncbi:MAG: ABC transporter permease, partial [Planctomycetota bacterium]|nr:ABC transporter permease [Planctomycetota bacterium]
MKLSPRFFLQTILLAVRQIRAHKLRSFLTTLGIMIGVASVSTVIAALTGLKEQVLSEFESFGASKMFVFPDQPDRAGQNRYPWREIKLKERELDGLVDNCPSFEQFTPNTDFRATVIHGRKEVPNINVVGIWPSWHDIENRPVIMGRPFVEADEIDAKPVAIVNDDAIAELELPPDPVGSI